MDASRSKRLFTLALAALFIGSVMPIRAGEMTESNGEFDLQLGEALSDMGDDLSALDLDFESQPDTAVSSKPFQIALNSAAIGETWRSSQAVSPQTTTSSGSAGQKWWKKKKWWVPVLVAVVAGAAVSGGDGDDNLDDEED